MAKIYWPVSFFWTRQSWASQIYGLNLPLLSHFSLIAPLQASVSGFFPRGTKGFWVFNKWQFESCSAILYCLGFLLKMFSMFRKKRKKRKLRAILCIAGTWVLNLCYPVVIKCSRLYNCFHMTNLWVYFQIEINLNHTPKIGVPVV